MAKGIIMVDIPQDCYGCSFATGYSECMRVLKPNGVLVFKWSEVQFPLSRILPLFSQQPLFGNRCRKRGNGTHWLCFMKEQAAIEFERISREEAGNA